MKNNTEARCQVRNKAKKLKITNILRLKERKKRKKEQICKVKQRQIRFIYIKDQLQGEKNSRKDKQKNKCRKNIIGLKN